MKFTIHLNAWNCNIKKPKESFISIFPICLVIRDFFVYLFFYYTCFDSSFKSVSTFQAEGFVSEPTCNTRKSSVQVKTLGWIRFWSALVFIALEVEWWFLRTVYCFITTLFTAIFRGYLVILKISRASFFFSESSCFLWNI